MQNFKPDFFNFTLGFVAAVLIAFYFSDSAASRGYLFSLVDADRNLKLIVNFSTFEDCRAALSIADFFNHRATCTPGE